MMTMTLQEAPFTIKIELTEGCNLGCSFCGLRGMREKGTKPWYFMTLETATIIAEEIKRVGWRSKIMFSMHGEPTLNPNIFNIIKVFRKNLPDASFHLFTNGYGIVNSDVYDIPEYVCELFNSGINNLMLDNYSPNGDWKRIVECFDDSEITYLKTGVEFFPNKKNDFRIMVIPPINLDDENVTRHLNNHCGAAFPKDASYNDKRCARPFREMVFRWDGWVNICCNDYRGEYAIENIHDKDIDDIWNHERFQAARIMLYNKDRKFVCCNGCTDTSVRVGLLPDKKGKETLPPITEVKKFLKNVLDEVGNEKPLSKIIVLRKWEQEQ
jgi:hypothetical protein